VIISNSKWNNCAEEKREREKERGRKREGVRGKEEWVGLPAKAPE